MPPTMVAPLGASTTNAAPTILPAPPKRATDALMRGHFIEASGAREALIRGDMAAAKRSMKWLAEHQQTQSIPEALLPYYSAMQESAKRFSRVSTLREAGAALALTLTKCADCHRNGQTGPRFAKPPVPTGEGRKNHMRRHQWVAQRMWERLVDGSDAGFNEAAKVLADQTWDVDVPALTGKNDAAAQTLAKHVHELSAESPLATTVQARTDLYGHFLATCATCHRLLGKGPVVDPAEPVAELTRGAAPPAAATEPATP